MEQWADRFVRKNGFEDVRADPEALDEVARRTLTLSLSLTLPLTLTLILTRTRVAISSTARSRRI